MNDGYETIRVDLEPHLSKEERVLFPMIRELATARTAPSFHCGTLQNPISVMLSEHDAVGDLLANSANSPTASSAGRRVRVVRGLFTGLEQLEADTHLHIHKENNLLFPPSCRSSNVSGHDRSSTHR